MFSQIFLGLFIGFLFFFFPLFLGLLIVFSCDNLITDFHVFMIVGVFCTCLSIRVSKWHNPRNERCCSSAAHSWHNEGTICQPCLSSSIFFITLVNILCFVSGLFNQFAVLIQSYSFSSSIVFVFKSKVGSGLSAVTWD